MFESTVASVNSLRDGLGALGLKNSKPDGKGTFRNVPFLIFRDQRMTGGRRLVKREYPLRDKGGAIDLGRKLHEFSFSACLLGKDAKQLKENLIEALDDAGAGELTHPDFGTLQVLVDTWECRYTADELNYYEFTITVYPAAEDEAPETSADTAAAVTVKKDSLFGSLGDTLSDAWQTVQEATDGATAVADAISGVYDDIANAIENVGILGSVNGLLSAVTQVKGMATRLVNAPKLLAANLLGALSGIASVADNDAGFKAYERIGVNLKRRQAATDTAHLDPAAAANINTLYYVATVATQTSQAEAASAVLTDALATDDGLSRTPELTTTTPVSSVSAPSTTQQDSAAGITRNDSTSVASENSPASFPLFESQADIERVTSELGQMLDDSTIAASDAGFTASSLELATFRLVVINDLRTRGIHLANVRNVTLNQTEPALVALYRETGDSLYWQRFGRRNSVPNPLLMPGGVSLEILDG
ncbi:DNA circularization protein [Kluyvera cryocrescens]|uniref:DNA circulation protein n=1 Tax=Myoviridae sp. ctrMq22 TaxID=2825181 RepID=A0A8S5NUL8_9CAUD|nr:DNA circularization N-terminal domain-containing protein [Kluyvera ascorbata]MDU3910644.1 DNA circularization N-terminal domain-containing protein [Kluyvera ascorbata]DAD98477.1 MAG TPA: DNA circulation protein [Myoviridae sp. ctrMq22]HBL0734334.1 DNA circularization protein [Kluyvera ascorbata]HDG1722337.1 DNA circularization protein [Kluyvera ascorbata]